MASYSDNYKIIKQALQDAFLNQDLSTRIQGIKKAEKQIEEYLERYRIISSGIKNKYDELARAETIESQSTRRYQAIKSFNNETNDIQSLLKEGYLYVDALREAFTGEKISYQVGIIQDGSLYQGVMDILELIEKSTLDVDSKVAIQNAAKLRMTKVSASQLNNPDQIILKNATENASSVFSAVYNYFNPSDLHKSPKVNQGNMYEVYRRIVFSRGGKNHIPPPFENEFETIAETYAEVKRNNAAYYKGGDIADIQVKYLGGRPPSLTTLSSIKRVLEKSLSAIKVIYSESKPKRALIRSLVNLFTQKSSNIVTEVERVANDKAQKQIQNRLNSIVGLSVTY